jgi:hypothetical protein
LCVYLVDIFLKFDAWVPFPGRILYTWPWAAMEPRTLTRKRCGF